MRRLTGAEIGLLVMTVLFICVGIDMALFPVEGVVSHQVYRSGRSGFVRRDVAPDGAGKEHLPR
jgi:hypothetical protein